MTSLNDQIKFAKCAYRAYGETTGNRNYLGLPMPEWDGLTPTIRSAWIAAAMEVVSHVQIVVERTDFTTKTIDVIYVDGE